MDARYLTVEEVRQYLGGFSRQMIYSLIHERKFPFIKVGRSLRFDIKAVDNWMAKNAVREHIQEPTDNIT